jgi:hypothetical protein
MEVAEERSKDFLHDSLREYIQKSSFENLEIDVGVVKSFLQQLLPITSCSDKECLYLFPSELSDRVIKNKLKDPKQYYIGGLFNIILNSDLSKRYIELALKSCDIILELV